MTAAALQMALFDPIESIAQAINAPKNRRKLVQDPKDQLKSVINALCAKPPAWVSGAGVMATRHWLAVSAKSAKVAKNERASVQALSAAYNEIESACKGPAEFCSSRDA